MLLLIVLLLAAILVTLLGTWAPVVGAIGVAFGLVVYLVLLFATAAHLGWIWSIAIWVVVFPIVIVVAAFLVDESQREKPNPLSYRTKLKARHRN